MINSILPAEIIGALLILLGLVTLAGELFSPSHGALALGGMIGLFLGAAILIGANALRRSTRVKVH